MQPRTTPHTALDQEKTASLEKMRKILKSTEFDMSKVMPEKITAHYDAILNEFETVLNALPMVHLSTSDEHKYERANLIAEMSRIRYAEARLILHLSLFLRDKNIPITMANEAIARCKQAKHYYSETSSSFQAKDASHLSADISRQLIQLYEFYADCSTPTGVTPPMPLTRALTYALQECEHLKKQESKQEDLYPLHRRLRRSLAAAQLQECYKLQQGDHPDYAAAQCLNNEALNSLALLANEVMEEPYTPFENKLVRFYDYHREKVIAHLYRLHNAVMQSKYDDAASACTQIMQFEGAFP